VPAHHLARVRSDLDDEAPAPDGDRGFGVSPILQNNTMAKPIHQNDRAGPHGIPADASILSVYEALELYRRSSAPGSVLDPSDLGEVVVEGVVTRVRPPARSGHLYIWLGDPDDGHQIEM
jgi:hypothetical protein